MQTASGLVRTRCTYWSDGGKAVSMSARCPDDGEAKPMEHCSDCSRLRGATREGDLVMLRCDVDAEPAPPFESLRATARRLTVWDVMGNDVTCVSSRASVEMAAALISQGDLRSVPVVDDEEKLCGILSRSDLVRVGFEDAGVSEATKEKLPRGFHETVIATRLVADVMTPVVHALPEDAPLSFAIALMARAGMHEVPVVQRDGVVVGMITALHVMQWLATRLGYDETPPGR